MLRKFLWLAIPFIGAISFYAISQVTAPAFPVINLSSEPLYSKGTGAKPTISLALSVEFPTVGAQYRDTYSTANEYIGYFDAESCYDYINDANADLRRFDRKGAAIGRGCAGAGFSGNFMNWATSSAIDVLRLGLTGGDRIVDTTGMTVLQRAVIQTNFWNSGSYFPAKNLPATLVTGAVPNILKGSYAGDIKIANCLNRVHFGTSATGSCAAPGNNSNLGVAGGANGTTVLSSDSFFYTRVKVCESNSGSLQDPRTEYCIKYDAGNYKPIGNLQKYSDRVRVAAFGYLMDNNYARYGGVLRAPMKYLGPKAYDDSGIQVVGTNPKVEWDPTTGVFTANPESATEGISGVVNYLNQFGRTATTPGVYKSYDPVSELYYESLRYVQGLQPTPAATSGITPAMQDGYPVYTSWTDPHGGGSKDKDYSCLKNNIILVGDVNTHGDKTIPGNTRTTGSDVVRAASAADNEPDFVFWTKVVGGFESNNAVSYPFGNLSPNPNSNNPNTVVNTARWGMEAQNAGSSNAAYYMAGMAYWANTHDIRGTEWTADTSKQRPGMRVKTYVIDVNENSANSAVNNRRNSQFFLAAKYGGFADKSGKGNPYLNADGALDNSNWQKNDDPGEAKTYYLASSARAVLNGLNEIFINVTSEGNSIAKGSVSSFNVTAGAYIYQSKYDPSDWTGNVLSIPITAINGNVTVDEALPQWKASTKLNAKTQSHLINTRKIYAGRTLGNTTGAAAIDFKWSSISNDVNFATGLDKATPTSTADGLAEARVNYLRGSNAMEGTSFRKRTSLLGDIVNSPIVYSNEFAKNVNTPAYKTFTTSNAGRPAALFVGANDGMLHAFNAADGEELFGYIPSWMAGKLSALTSPTYNTSQHQSYVDGQIDVGEALVGTSWKTVLLGSTGAGGQGVYALDVSNPGSFTAANAMWEFTDKDDSDLGNVIGKPRILKLRTTKKSDAIQKFEWFAVVPSGVNNYANDGQFSSTGKPALFLLSLNKPAGTPWTLGLNYLKLTIPSDATLSSTIAPGLINFTAATGSSDEVSQIYTGDLHGNLWKLDFDLASDGSSGQALSAMTFANLTSGTSYKPLFISTDSVGKTQPITMAPTVVIGPNQGTIVVFGTGKYLESTDNILTGAQIQSVYAIYDAEFASGTLKYITGRGKLKQGSISAGLVNIDSFTWGRPSTDSDTTQRAGWYIDYLNAGEKQVSDFTLFGDRVIFGSIIPPQNVNDPCVGGKSNLYALGIAGGSGSSASNGSGTVESSSVGLISQPYVVESKDASVTTSDSAGRRTKTITKKAVVVGSTGIQVSGTTQIDTIILGRLSWRQINNYQELKNKPL